MQLQKDLLFFSNFCNHCKEIISTISKKNLKDHFLMVSVDNKKYKIPNFIHSVPTILTTNKKIYTDVNIINYINSIKTQDTVNELSPFTMQSSYSSQYTYLTADGYDDDGSLLNKDMTHNNNFNLLESDERIIAPVDDDDSKSSKFDSAIYERFVNSRTNDDEHIKQKLDIETKNAIMR